MAPLRLLAMCLVPLLLRVGFAKPVLSYPPLLQARQGSRPVPAVPNGCDMVKAVVFDPADVVTSVYAEIAFYSIAVRLRTSGPMFAARLAFYKTPPS